MVRPTSTAEVVAAINAVAAAGLRVRPTGSGHSFTPLVPTDGVLLDLAGMERLLEVDHDHARVRAEAGITLGLLADALLERGLAFEARVGDHHVVVAVPRQPQRLGQGEGRAPRRRHRRQGTLEGPAAAQRLRRHPDRLAPGASGEVGGIVVERAEVEHRERRVEVGGRSVEPGPPCLAVLGHAHFAGSSGGT